VAAETNDGKQPNSYRVCLCIDLGENSYSRANAAPNGGTRGLRRRTNLQAVALTTPTAGGGAGLVYSSMVAVSHYAVPRERHMKRRHALASAASALHLRGANSYSAA